MLGASWQPKVTTFNLCGKMTRFSLYNITENPSSDWVSSLAANSPSVKQRALSIFGLVSRVNLGRLPFDKQEIPSYYILFAVLFTLVKFCTVVPLTHTHTLPWWAVAAEGVGIHIASTERQQQQKNM